MLIILYYNAHCHINTHIDSDIAIAARLYKTFDLQSIVAINLAQPDPFSYIRVLLFSSCRNIRQRHLSPLNKSLFLDRVHENVRLSEC